MYLTVISIYISLVTSDIEYLHMLIGHLYIFLGELSTQVLCMFSSGCFIVQL